jgi:hypothetical protein
LRLAIIALVGDVFGCLPNEEKILFDRIVFGEQPFKKGDSPSLLVLGLRGATVILAATIDPTVVCIHQKALDLVLFEARLPRGSIPKFVEGTLGKDLP